MVCQRAITLLREDSVAWLAGSLARSAWYVLRRNPPCLPRRLIVSESSSSKESIPHWTHNIGERVHPEEPSVTNLFYSYLQRGGDLANCLTVPPHKTKWFQRRPLSCRRFFNAVLV